MKSSEVIKVKSPSAVCYTWDQPPSKSGNAVSDSAALISIICSRRFKKADDSNCQVCVCLCDGSIVSVSEACKRKNGFVFKESTNDVLFYINSEGLFDFLHCKYILLSCMDCVTDSCLKKRAPWAEWRRLYCYYHSYIITFQLFQC